MVRVVARRCPTPEAGAGEVLGEAAAGMVVHAKGDTMLNEDRYGFRIAGLDVKASMGRDQSSWIELSAGVARE